MADDGIISCKKGKKMERIRGFSPLVIVSPRDTSELKDFANVNFYFSSRKYNVERIREYSTVRVIYIIYPYPSAPRWIFIFAR